MLLVSKIVESLQCILNEILCKTKLDQLYLYLQEACVSMIFFRLFRWNLRKIKK